MLFFYFCVRLRGNSLRLVKLEWCHRTWPDWGTRFMHYASPCFALRNEESLTIICLHVRKVRQVTCSRPSWYWHQRVQDLLLSSLAFTCPPPPSNWLQVVLSGKHEMEPKNMTPLKGRGEAPPLPWQQQCPELKAENNCLRITIILMSWKISEECWSGLINWKNCTFPHLHYRCDSHPRCQCANSSSSICGYMRLQQ